MSKIKELRPNLIPIQSGFNTDWGDIKLNPRGVGLDTASDVYITEENQQLIQQLTSPEFQRQQTQELNRVLKSIVGRNLFTEQNEIDTSSSLFTDEEIGLMRTEQKPFAQLYNELYKNKGVVYEEDFASKALNQSMTNGWVKMLTGYDMGNSLKDLKLTNNGFTFEDKQLKLSPEENKVLSDFYNRKKGLDRERFFVEDVAELAASLIIDLPLMYLTGAGLGAALKAGGAVGKAMLVANNGFTGRLVNQAVQQAVQFNIMGIPQTVEAFNEHGAGGGFLAIAHNAQMGALGAATGALGRGVGAKAIARVLEDRPALAEELGSVAGAFGFGTISSKVMGESWRDALASGLAFAGTHFTNPTAMKRVLAEQGRSGKAIYTEQWDGKGFPADFSPSYFVEEQGQLFKIDAKKAMVDGVIKKTSNTPLELTDRYRRYNETENHVLMTFGQALSNERLSRASKELYDKWTKELPADYVKDNQDRLQILALSTAGQVIVGRTDKLFNKVKLPEDTVLNDKMIQLSNDWEMPYSEVTKYVIGNLPRFFSDPQRFQRELFVERGGTLLPSTEVLSPKETIQPTAFTDGIKDAVETAAKLIARKVEIEYLSTTGRTLKSENTPFYDFNGTLMPLEIKKDVATIVGTEITFPFEIVKNKIKTAKQIKEERTAKPTVETKVKQSEEQYVADKVMEYVQSQRALGIRPTADEILQVTKKARVEYGKEQMGKSQDIETGERGKGTETGSSNRSTDVEGTKPSPERVEEASKILTGEVSTPEVIKRAEELVGKGFNQQFQEYLQEPNNAARLREATDRTMEEGLILEDFARRTVAADLIGEQRTADLPGRIEQLRSELRKQPEIIGDTEGKAIQIELPDGSTKIFVMGEGNHKEPLAQALRYITNDLMRKGKSEPDAMKEASDYLDKATVEGKLDIGDVREGKFSSSERKSVSQVEKNALEAPQEANVKKPTLTPTEPEIVEPKRSIEAVLDPVIEEMKMKAEELGSQVRDAKRGYKVPEITGKLNEVYALAERTTELLKEQMPSAKVKVEHVLSHLLKAQGLNDKQIAGLIYTKTGKFVTDRNIADYRRSKGGTYLAETMVSKFQPTTVETPVVSASESIQAGLSRTSGAVTETTKRSEVTDALSGAFVEMRRARLDPLNKSDIAEASNLGVIDDLQRSALLKNIRQQETKDVATTEQQEFVSRLDDLLAKGKITQEQYDASLKAVLGETKPTERFITDEQYQKDKKDVNDILSRPGAFPSQLEAVPQLLRMGAYHLENVIRSGIEKAAHVVEWSKRMVQELGEWIKPHLSKIWDEIKAYSTGERAFLDPNVLGMLGGKISDKRTILEKMKDPSPEAHAEQLQELTDNFQRWQTLQRVPGLENPRGIADKIKNNKLVRKAVGIGDILYKGAIQNRNYADQRNASGDIKHPVTHSIYHMLEKEVVLKVSEDINRLMESKEGWNLGKDFRQLPSPEGFVSKYGKYANDIADGKRQPIEPQRIEKGETLQQFVNRAGDELGYTPAEKAVELHIQIAARETQEKVRSGYEDFVRKDMVNEEGKTVIADGLNKQELRTLFGDKLDYKVSEPELYKSANNILVSDKVLMDKVVNHIVDKLAPRYYGLYRNEVRPSAPHYWSIIGERPLDKNGNIATKPEDIVEWQRLNTYGETKTEAQQKAQQYVNEGFAITGIDRIGDLITREQYDRLTANQLMNLVDIGRIEPSDPIIKALLNATKTGNYEQHSINKKYIKGMHYTPKELEMNMENLIKEAVNASTRRFGLAKVRGLLASQRGELNAKLKSVLVSDSEKDRFRRDYDYATQIYNQVSHSDKSFIDAWRQGATAWYVGMKPSFWFQQMMQPLQTALPEAMAEAKNTTLSGLKAWNDGFVNAVELGRYLLAERRGQTIDTKLSSEFIELYRKLDAQNLMSAVGIEELTGKGRDIEMRYGSDMYKGWNKLIKLANMGGAAAEKFTRLQALSTFYDIGKARGLSGKGLEDYVATKVKDVMGGLGALDRPAIFQSKQLGRNEQKVLKAIDKTFFTFKTYANTNLGQYDRLFRNRHLGAAGLKAIIGVGMHGVTRLPLAATIFALVDLFTEDDSEYETLKFLDELDDKFGTGVLGSILAKGIPSQSGINFQNLFDERTAFATDVYAETRARSVEGKLAEAMFGAPYGLAKDIVESGAATSKLVQNRIFDDPLLDEDEKKRAIKNVKRIAPIAFRNILSAMSLAEDGVELRGKEVLKSDDISWADVVYKALGFNPTVVQDTYEYQFSGTPAKLSRARGKQIELKRIRKEINASKDYDASTKSRELKKLAELMKEAIKEEATLTKQLKAEKAGR